MFALIALLLLVVPIAELWLIIRVANEIGFMQTLGSLVLISVVGAWLLRQQGTATWTRLQAALARGEMPAKEVVDGALILSGGALLLTPGFLSDAVGLLLLLPPTRAVVKGLARRMMARRARLVSAGFYPATVVRTQRREDLARDFFSELPPEGASGDEDDSPGRG